MWQWQLTCRPLKEGERGKIRLGCNFIHTDIYNDKSTPPAKYSYFHRRFVVLLSCQIAVNRGGGDFWATQRRDLQKMHLARDPKNPWTLDKMNIKTANIFCLLGLGLLGGGFLQFVGRTSHFAEIAKTNHLIGCRLLWIALPIHSPYRTHMKTDVCLQWTQ